MDAPGASTSGHKTKAVNINTSLSTLSPIHYEAMNTAKTPAPAGTHGGPKLTMRDIVKWHQEEAFCLGEVGFHTNFPNPSEIFKPFKFSTESSVEVQNPADIDDDAAMTAATQALHKQIIGLKQRRQIMNANQAMVAQTELDVTQKLRAAGVPEERLGHKTTLRQKVVELIRLKLPEPEPNFVGVWVEVPLADKGRGQALELNLPLDARMNEVYALLAEVVAAMFSARGFIYERGGAWKYQLVDRSKSRLLLNKSLPLETNLDYRGMLQQISREGDRSAPVAVLTQVRYSSKFCRSLLKSSVCLLYPLEQEGSTVRPIDTNEAGGGDVRTRGESMDSDVSEVFDDYDGKPFFEPLVDMDLVVKKYAHYGEDAKEENGIHGFWR